MLPILITAAWIVLISGVVGLCRAASCADDRTGGELMLAADLDYTRAQTPGEGPAGPLGTRSATRIGSALSTALRDPR